MQKRFIILDGSSLMHRAFYALPLLTTAAGEYTNAIYGFATMLTRLLGDLKPDLLVIAFDKGKKTFRNDLFADYKGTRKKTPVELSSQIPHIHELAEAFNICLVEQAGYEADDIIGTLATKAVEHGHEAIVVTGDKDALQLIRPDLKVMLTRKGISDMQVFDEAAFREAYGFSPLQMIDLKGLMGDSSDNIPGVPGVGEKTATKLLLEYGSVEAVLEHIGEISGKKLKENLTANRELAILSKRLATIVCDMDLVFDEAAYTVAPQREEVRSFCSRYEFKNLLRKVDELFPAEDGLGFGTVVEATLPKFRRLVSAEEFAAVADLVRAEKKVVFSPLLGGAVPHLQLLGIAISLESEIVYADAALPGWHFLRALLTEGGIAKVTHELKPLYHVEPLLAGEVFDTMLAAYLLDPAANADAYALSELLSTYGLDGASPPAFGCAEDKAVWEVFCIRQLAPVLQAELKKSDLLRLYEDVELPLLSVLAALERTGIYVNRSHLKTMAVEVAAQIEELLKDIYTLAGIEFNVNSPKQLGEVLFERLQLPTAKKTKTGYSTNAEVLEGLREQHPLVEKVLAYRLWSKLKSTYLDGLDLLIDESTSRIHSTFNQMVTATGRLSSSDPNLQNIPVRTAEGKKIRELFEPGEGYDYLLSADYSQIELRVLAHMSQDKNFLEAFNEEQDIHARTASEVFGIPMEAMTAEYRGKAKAVNFGIVYGISDYGLSRDLNISRKEAAQYIESYFEKCPGVKAYIDSVVQKAHKDGFVTTLFGRRRYLPGINSSNYNQRTLSERMAMNTPIQGTAADIIKLAMLEVHRQLATANLRSRMLLQVHDELVLEVVASEVEIVSDILRQAMQNVVQMSVPLTVDVNIGKNWAQAK